jgi:HlyD family secretion protein
MKKMIIIFLLALALAALYQYRTGASKSGAPPAGLRLYGNVDIREVSLAFLVAGRLAGLNYEEGDRVEAGEVLARLDTRTFEEELAVRRATVKEIEAGLVNAEKTYERQANLVRLGSAPVSNLDEAQARRDELKARLETGRAQLAQAETSLDETSLLAPDSGIIMTRVREAGSILPAGAAVYTLALDTPVWVRTYIDEPNLGRIHPGLTATILTDSGGQYSGHIGFISPQAEFTPKTVETAQLRTDLVYRLRVTVDKPDQGLRQGMPVTLELAPSGR